MGTNLYKDTFGVLHCLDCYEYGEINEEMVIYRSVRTLKDRTHFIDIDYTLTKQQEFGSNFLVQCYEKFQSAFLQAVCGAGKTEMTYQVILDALNANKKVCFVLPRVEVLKELSKRFIKHFPNTKIATLYEGHKNYEEANFILSTPQQLIYFYQEFDLIIVDEVDAFPYENNTFLQRLVKKSLICSGTTIYMSATMTEEIKHLIDNREIESYIIPSRYHYKPLVIPKFIRIKNNKQPTQELFQYLEKNQRKKRQCLVFVASIKAGKSLCKHLNLHHMNHRFISSGSIDKSNIIKEFRHQDYLFLVTTTVLERGVTFDDIDCYVYKADNSIFTKQSLIQISGRVGRALEYQTGQVVFFSEYTSKHMKLAAKEIIFMNHKNTDEMQTL